MESNGSSGRTPEDCLRTRLKKNDYSFQSQIPEKAWFRKVVKKLLSHFEESCFSTYLLPKTNIKV